VVEVEVGVEVGVNMLNGYSYTFDTPTPCERCHRPYKCATNKGNVYYKLWEYNKKKICRTCIMKTREVI